MRRTIARKSWALEAADATGDSYGYDDWGNLLSKTLTKGTAENLSVTVDVHNHVTSGGVVYDAAGNMTDDGLNTFAYNAENQMTSGAGKTFTYDGDGRRVSKSGYHLYWPDTGYSPLVETDFSGVMQREFIYFNGQKVALISSAGNPYYFLHDHLGSSSVMTSGTGLTVQAEYDFYPFGGERQITFQIDNRYRFTSYERDTESGNDYAVFRQYSSRLGRFLSVDPVAGTAGSPQSLNRYSYVLNDSTNSVDLHGLSPSDRDPHGEPRFQDVTTWDAGGSCYANGFLVSCGTAYRWMDAGIAAVCPGNSCSGFASTKDGWGPWVQYYVFAGSASGYFRPGDVATAYEWNGRLYTPTGWSNYLQSQIDAQKLALAKQIAAATGQSVSDIYSQLTYVRTEGGNADFSTGSLDLSFFSSCGNALGERCGEYPSIHLHNGLVHLDTANPIANVPFGLLTHFFVDVLLGHVNGSVPFTR